MDPKKSLLAIVLACFLFPQTSRADAEWTAILLLSARYDDMRTRLSWTGSSADVNVLVLHDNDGQGISAYKMLPDADTTDPVGECCPGTDPDCCGSVELDVTDMGIDVDANIYDVGVLENFFGYIVANYPANNYMVSARGQMGGAVFLSHNSPGDECDPDDWECWENMRYGVTIGEFADALEVLTDASGSKVDVVNIGLCLGGVVDWAYGLKDVADYFVGSANYTNAPVASRWRFYLWARELIKNPSITGRELASYIPEAFALTTQSCISSGHGCSNANSGQPWTCAAWDLSKFPALASAQKNLTCKLLEQYDAYEQDINDALNSSVAYGDSCSYGYCRPDFRHLALEIKNKVNNAGVGTSAEAVVTALDDALVANRFENDAMFGDTSRLGGLSTYVVDGSFEWEYDAFGDYQYDSMWRRLLAASSGSDQVTITGLTVAPTTVSIKVGESVALVATAESQEYGPLCAVDIDWDRAGLLDIATVVSTGASSAKLTGAYPGTGTLKARAGTGQEVTVQVEITPDDGSNNNNNGNGNSGDGTTGSQGCNCGASGEVSWLLPVLLVGLVGFFWGRRG